MGAAEVPLAESQRRKFGRILSENAVSSGAFEEHFEGPEIMIRRLRRDLSDQPVSERYNILLGNLGHRVIRALAEKLQKVCLSLAALLRYRIADHEAKERTSGACGVHHR